MHSEGYRNHTEFLGNGSLDSLLTLLLAELLELETMHLHLGPTGPPRAYPEHIYHMHVYHSWLAGHVLVTYQSTVSQAKSNQLPVDCFGIMLIGHTY